MWKRRIRLNWFVRISLVAVLAVAAGLVSLADPPAASASHDRINLNSISMNHSLEEGRSYGGFSLYFRHAQSNDMQPVTNLDQITVKYTVVGLDGASDADFDYDVALGEQVTYTAVGRLVYGKYHSVFRAHIPLVEDSVADPGERVAITLKEVGLTELGDSTDGHTTGTYSTYDLDKVHLQGGILGILSGRTWTIPITDNDTLPDAPTNLDGEVWGTDRVHLRWRAGEDGGGTVNGEEQPLRYQYHITSIGKPTFNKATAEGWVDMEGDNITSFTVQDSGINLGLHDYDFRVRAISDAGASDPSEPFTATRQDFPPAPPRNLRARATGPASVLLEWDQSIHGGFIGGLQKRPRYQYRVENIPTAWIDIPGEETSSHTVSWDLWNNDLTFQIRAINDHGHSWTSGDIVAVGRVPSPPKNLTAEAVGQESPDSVVLRWERSESKGVAPGSTEPLPVHYQYRIENIPTEWRDIPGGDVVTYTVTGLDLANTTYTFQIRAANEVGPSWTSGDIPSIGMLDLVGPAISKINITSYPEDGSLDTGEQVKVVVTFDEDVFLVGRPQFALDIGGEEKVADFVAHANNSIFFEYTIAEGDSDDDGIVIPANPFRLDGDTIRDAAGNDAALDFAATAPSADHKVNLAPETTPTIASIAIISDPGEDGVYSDGDEIQISVAFAPPGEITVTGAPQLTLDIGGSARTADYKTFNYDGVTSLVFAYTIAAGDHDGDGISIPADAIDLNGGSISDSDSTAAVLTHAAVPSDAAHPVDTAPSLSYVILVNITEASRIYTEGEQIELEAKFTEDVTVTGEPQLAVVIGDTTRYAALQRAEGDSMFFAYTVQVGDQDHNGILVPSKPLVLNNGTITDGAGNAAVLTYGEGALWPNFLVDALPPEMLDAETSNSGQEVIITFSEEIGPAPLLVRAAQAVGVDASVFYQALFNVYVDNFEVVPSSASIHGNQLWLSILDHVTDVQAVAVSYDNLFAKAAPGILVDRGGNPLANFDDRSAANLSQISPEEPTEGEEVDVPVILKLTSTAITMTEGSQATYTVVMGHPPLEGDETTVQISSVPDGLLNVSAQGLSFTAGNWDQPQTVTIEAQADNDSFDNWAAIIHDPSGAGVQYPAWVRVVIEEDN